MAKPRVLILRAPGTNCDEETAHAFSLAGGAPERWHVNRILEEPRRLADFQVLCIPGGFSYGDDIAAGRILGNQLQHHLAGPLQDFRAAGKLVLGICNGFQVLLKTKLLANEDDHTPAATLALNDSARFECRWVRLAVEAGNCVFLHGITEIELPVAHAEGRFVVRDEATLQRLDNAGRLVLRYVKQADPQTALSVSTPKELGLSTSHLDQQTTVPYPDNPNGAMANVAGLCDATGRVLGLMPHPERFVVPTQHPRWTRQPQSEVGDGLRVFQNAIRYFS
jgi:phosphoribosylformylglycinamidine synthase